MIWRFVLACDMVLGTLFLAAESSLLLSCPGSGTCSPTVSLAGVLCGMIAIADSVKREAALASFPIDPRGCTVADIGASTGGFTDCLLQNGAAAVYAVDAGHGQLHPRLREDPRVCSAEGVNARALTPADLRSIHNQWQVARPDGTATSFEGQVDGIVMDVSFISQTLLHPALASILREGGWMIALVKPQFELSRSALNKQGIVKQEKDRKAALDRVIASAAACGFEAVSVIPSPIEGGDGNREFLAYFRKNHGTN